MPHIEQVTANIRRRIGVLKAGLSDVEKARIGMAIFDPEAESDPDSLMGRLEQLEADLDELQAIDLTAIEQSLNQIEAEIEAAREGKESLLDNLQDIRANAGGGDLPSDYYPAFREILVAEAGQTVFTLNNSYPVDGHSLQVFVNGLIQAVGIDYEQTDEHTVTFNYGLEDGDIVLFQVVSSFAVNIDASLGATAVRAREWFIAGPGQTDFSLETGSFSPSTGHLLVYRDGQLMTPGMSGDYVELDSTTIRFHNPLSGGERVTMIVLGATQSESGDPDSGGSGVGFVSAGITDERIDLLASLVRAANHAGAEPYVGQTLVIDPLSDLSMIDIAGSAGYIWKNGALRQAPQTPDWVQFDAPTKPSGRYGHAMAYDFTRGVVVLFGGSSGSRLNDTWEYDGTDWVEVQTANKPSGRYYHAIAYDSARGVVVLFGGSSGSSFSDTWEYDGTDWVEVQTANKPSGRHSHAMAYDSTRGVVVLFGGMSGSSNLNDTWEYDGTDWVQVQTANKPSGRYGHAMAYDSARGVVVLFGGYANLNDTWEYDGADWVQVQTANKPSGRHSHAMAYDSARGVVVLFGGYSNLNDTWEYDGTDWVEVQTANKPSARYSHAIAYDSARGVVVLFGGYGNLNDTWELVYPSSDVIITTEPIVTEKQPKGVGVVAMIDGNESGITISVSLDDGQTWLPLSPNQRASLDSLSGTQLRLKFEWTDHLINLHSWGVTWDYGHELPPDSETRYPSLGITDRDMDALEAAMRASKNSDDPFWSGHLMAIDSLVDLSGIDTDLSAGYIWRDHGVQQQPMIPDWLQIDAPTKPSERYNHAMAYDSTRGVVVLFGGSSSSNLNDTWEYDGTDWVQVQTANKPSGRYSHAMAYDSARGVVVLFGGYASLSDTWEYDGTDWVEVQTANKPSGRHSHAMAYDSTRGVVVLFGGMSGTTRLNDTWEYNGSDWVEIQTANKPPHRQYHTMVYDSARGVVVLFGGYTGSRLNDTWEYDGTDWVEVQTANKPSGRSNHAMAYDSTRGVVVLFGGSSSSDLNDTWEYDGTDWVQVQTANKPSGRYGHAMAYDSARGVVVLFGGSSSSSDTWKYNGSDWVEVQTANNPTGRSGHAMAYDSTRGVVVLFGGSSGSGLNDTWELVHPSSDVVITTKPIVTEKQPKGVCVVAMIDGDESSITTSVSFDDGQTWLPLSPNQRASLDSLSGTQLRLKFEWTDHLINLHSWGVTWDYGHELPPDSETRYPSLGITDRDMDALEAAMRASKNSDDPFWSGHLMAIDSLVDLSGIDTDLSAGYIWRDHGVQQQPMTPDWLHTDVPSNPPARYSHAMAYDSTRGVVVLFGGYASLSDTWEYDGTDWVEVQTANKPSGRYGHAMAYDSGRGVVVLFGGYASLSDTWEYDGSDWVEVQTANKPSGRYYHAIAYDSTRGVVVLFGGSSGSLLNDTWEYDGTDWVEVQTANKPSGRYSHAMAYDSARGVVVLFGGRSGSSNLNDTWELTYPSSLVSLTTKPITAEQVPKGIGVVAAVVGDRYRVTTSVSRDDGATWLPLTPGERFSLDQLPQGNKIRLKFEWEDSVLRLLAWGVTWDYGLQSLSDGGSFADDLSFQNAINLAKTNFRLNSHMDAVRQKLSGLIIDVFTDTSAIDLDKSTGYEYDPTTKEFQAIGEVPADVVSQADNLDAAPSHVYFVPHLPDDAEDLGNTYFLSLDGGDTWFEVDPETLTDVPSGANVSDPPMICCRAVMPAGGRLSGWAYGWV